MRKVTRLSYKVAVLQEAVASLSVVTNWLRTSEELSVLRQWTCFRVALNCTPRLLSDRQSQRTRLISTHIRYQEHHHHHHHHLVVIYMYHISWHEQDFLAVFSVRESVWAIVLVSSDEDMSIHFPKACGKSLTLNRQPKSPLIDVAYEWAGRAC